MNALDRVILAGNIKQYEIECILQLLIENAHSKQNTLNDHLER